MNRFGAIVAAGVGGCLGVLGVLGDYWGLAVCPCPWCMDGASERARPAGRPAGGAIDYENAVYRYRTAFAHLNAADKGEFRDPAAALNRALKLQVPCGKFSYANIQPASILGVSGTLEALGAYELKVMERYGIQLYASMPSVYGETQLKFDHAGDAIHTECSLDGFHRKITDEANRKIRDGRAVIVFFEAGRLNEYTASPYFKKVPQANVLHERLDPKARDYVIRKAATQGQATFASEAFGRGTDFFCKDSKLTTAGQPRSARARTHTRTHARTRTHTHVCVYPSVRPSERPT